MMNKALGKIWLCMIFTLLAASFSSAQDVTWNGHTYRLIDSGMTWTEAEAYCRKLGGHLATSTSAEENSFLQTIAQGVQLWLGGNDINNEGIWEWVTGEPWSYTNWDAPDETGVYQPDNYMGKQNALSMRANGKWDDLNHQGESGGTAGDGYHGFICEWDNEGKLELSALERGTQTPASDYSGLLGRIVNGRYTDDRSAPLNEASIAEISSSVFGKTGFTADGNTRLMLRAQTDKPGTITFSIPSELGALIENLSRSSQSSSSVSIAAEKINDTLWQATAILTAPADYPSAMSFPSASFNVSVNFRAEDGSVEEKTLALSANATPVVFIHGIFGESESAFGMGESKGIWHILNQAGVNTYFWSYNNRTGPTDVIPAGKASLLYGKIASVCMDYASRGIACTRVDLVGHSMGGLMARRFTVADYGHRMGIMSYGQGAVRRIITVATPHRGSPISNLVGKLSTLRNFSR